MMKKYYDEPLLEIRKYQITTDIFTDSNDGNGNLHDDDEYDYFGNN